MRRLTQGDVVNHFERKPFQSCYFWGMIRQQLYTTQAQVMKYLRSDSVISIRAITRLQTRFTLADVTFLHDRVGAQLIDQVETVFSLPQVKVSVCTRTRIGSSVLTFPITIARCTSPLMTFSKAIALNRP